MKGHKNLRKMPGKKPNLNLLNMNAYIKLSKLYPFVLKILSGNEILISIKGQNSVTNVRKTGNNPNLDLVNINAYINFGEILSICSKNIERKRNSHKSISIAQL